jgi:hypothetical protein
LSQKDFSQGLGKAKELGAPVHITFENKEMRFIISNWKYLCLVLCIYFVIITTFWSLTFGAVGRIRQGHLEGGPKPG